MALFRRKKKDKEEKEVEEKATKVDVAKKDKKQVSPKKSMKELYGEREIETGQRDPLRQSDSEASEKGKPTSAKASTSVKTSADKSAGKEGKKVRKYGDAYRILVKPLITEKATMLGAENKYVFAVSRDSNKIEIARAINEVYGIKPVSVNIIKVKGKNVRYGRTQGKQKDWKKAIIELPEGKTIKVYEGV